MNANEQLQGLKRAYINLANERLGAEAIFSTDDFFGPMQRMLNPAEPMFIPDKFDEHGKWMDGWESRRKRGGGYDYCIVRLGVSGIIKAVDLDTRDFTGNYPPNASLDACYSERAPDEQTEWKALIPRSGLQGDAHNLFDVDNTQVWNHVRLNIYPDGGIARLRVYGNVYRDWNQVDHTRMLDLVAVENGGRALACNDEHFGAMGNLIMPGKGINMGDGWETRRRREPGHDWVVLQLGHAGKLDNVIIDTAFFKGNYPDRVSMDAACLPEINQATPLPEDIPWQPLLTEHNLSADSEHRFKAELEDVAPVSHVRINIHPDGGLSRIRVFGYIHKQDCPAG